MALRLESPPHLAGELPASEVPDPTTHEIGVRYLIVLYTSLLAYLKSFPMKVVVCLDTFLPLYK